MKWFANLKQKKYFIFLSKYLFLNKYVLSIMFFFIWMVFFDSNSFLVIAELDKQIGQYEEKLAYYKKEYQQNNDFYNRLMYNKSERERFARENYFMKKKNEEIFILVVDSTKVK